MCEVGKSEKKKFAKNIFWRLWKKCNLYWLTCLALPWQVLPNLMTLAWKMSSGMSKEVGSLNGPLCAYLMRHNHDLTRPRSKGNKCPCQVWKWSVKNYGRESVNEACLSCRPPARSGDDNTRKPLTHRGPVDLRKWAIFNTILMSPKSWLSQED